MAWRGAPSKEVPVSKMARQPPKQPEDLAILQEKESTRTFKRITIWETSKLMVPKINRLHRCNHPGWCRQFAPGGFAPASSLAQALPPAPN